MVAGDLALVGACSALLLAKGVAVAGVGGAGVASGRG